MNRHEPIIASDLLLHLLKQTRPVTLHALAMQMQWPAHRTTMELERLRHAGCQFDEHPQYGITLRQSSINTWADVLEQYAWPHGHVEIHRTTPSTQTLARQRLKTRGKDAANTLIVADHQSAGRGRFGRNWSAPPGKALTLSFVAPLDMSVDRLNLAISVVLAQALDHHLQDTPYQTVIKWPNDIYTNARKIAGILIETATLPVVGIGINTHIEPNDWPSDVRDKATSLAQLGVEVDRLAVLVNLLHTIRQHITMLQHADPACEHHMLQQWRQRCTMLHQVATLRSEGRDIEGEVLDVDPDAGLIVRTHTGQIVHLPAASTTVL